MPVDITVAVRPTASHGAICFGQINGDGAQRLLQETRPPRGYLMVSFTDLGVAEHSRSAQGQVHVSTTAQSMEGRDENGASMVRQDVLLSRMPPSP